MVQEKIVLVDTANIDAHSTGPNSMADAKTIEAITASVMRALVQGKAKPKTVKDKEVADLRPSEGR